MAQPHPHPQPQLQAKPQVQRSATIQDNKEVKKYNYFIPTLSDDSYSTGDVYSKDDVTKAQLEWELHSLTPKPYLQHIKHLSGAWPSLRLLADFMEVGTSPIRWSGLKGNPDDRNERASRTNVTRLDYPESGPVVEKTYTTPKELEEALNENSTADQRKFRVYIVEDLSRDVIELLGGKLDIEPAFFREQIFNYAWYNVRDRWMEPRPLQIDSRRQRWLQLRFVTARYFKTDTDFTGAFNEAQAFNVFRRPEDDCNNKSRWDQKDAIVGLSRAKASFWTSSDNKKEGPVGVLLVDPTIQQGHPLWYNYRNWADAPSISETAAPRGPPYKSFYTDLIFWAQQIDGLNSPATPDPNQLGHKPVTALLRLVCSEWLTITDYIRTRLEQIEWEISNPDDFLDKGSDIDVALKKLHIWRRLVPLYREMLTETLQGVFHFPCHPISSPSITGLGSTGATNCKCHVHDAATKKGPISALSDDFVRVLSYMEEYQQRIDRLTSVVTAIITIDDSRRGRDDNRNVARLTWLATFFIPLSFVASLFSMQADLTTLGDTIKWYFATSLPIAFLSLGLAHILGLPAVQKKWGEALKMKMDKKK